MNDLYIIGGLLVVVVIIAIIKATRFQTAEKDIEERQRRNHDEAQRFFMDMEGRKQLPFTQVDVVLKEGEAGVFQEPSVLLETRAYRIYGGAGTRIGRIYVGGRASESHQRLREIDSGTPSAYKPKIDFRRGSRESIRKAPGRNISKRLVGRHRNQLKPTTKEPNLQSSQSHNMGADDSDVSEW
jgi:hypothetical protein